MMFWFDYFDLELCLIFKHWVRNLGWYFYAWKWRRIVWSSHRFLENHRKCEIILNLAFRHRLGFRITTLRNHIRWSQHSCKLLKIKVDFLAVESESSVSPLKQEASVDGTRGSTLQTPGLQEINSRTPGNKLQDSQKTNVRSIALTLAMNELVNEGRH